MSKRKKTFTMLGRLTGVDDFIGPRRLAPEFYAGERFVPRDAERYKGGATTGRRNKFARRRVRNYKMRGRIDSLLAILRHGMEQVKRLASNSHEKKRYLVQAKKEAAMLAAATVQL